MKLHEDRQLFADAIEAAARPKDEGGLGIKSVFIEKDYWLENFNKVKNEYLQNSETYVYTEDEEIKGFISLMENGYIGALFVKNDCLREGIGRRLLNYVKEKYSYLSLNVYEKNIDATLFYVAMGFKNTKIQIDEDTR